MEQHTLTLGIPSFTYADLYDAARLKDLLNVFDASVKHHDVELYDKFAAYRQNQGVGLKPEDISDLLVNMGPYVGKFVAQLFNVTEQHQAQAANIKDEIDSIFTYKNEVVEKLGVVFKGQDTDDWPVSSILNRFDLLIEAAFPEANQDDDAEHRVARVGAVIGLLSGHYKLLAKGKASDCQNADKQVEALRAKLAAHELAATEFNDLINAPEAAELVSGLMDIVQRWSFIAQQDNDVVADWLSFKVPEKRDFDHLVEHETVDRGEFTAWMGELEHRRRRDGFKLTDPRFNQRQVLSEVNHCIYCHERDTDSCSKGMRNKKTETFKVDPLGVTTIGCPLDEKISEMHLVKRQGDNIGALAIIIIDNPFKGTTCVQPTALIKTMQVMQAR